MGLVATVVIVVGAAIFVIALVEGYREYRTRTRERDHLECERSRLGAWGITRKSTRVRAYSPNGKTRRM